MFYNKYLKYKKKYLDLKLKGGADRVCKCGRTIYGRHCGDKCCESCTNKKEDVHTPECEKNQEKKVRLTLKIKDYENNDGTSITEVADSNLNGSYIFIAEINYVETDKNKDDIQNLKMLKDDEGILETDTFLVAKFEQSDGGLYITDIKKYIETKSLDIKNFYNKMTNEIKEYSKNISIKSIKLADKLADNKLRVQGAKNEVDGEKIITLTPSLD